MTAKWSITQELGTAHLTQVFSGGACNILDDNGKLLRNSERDRINDWLTEKKVIFFDPQIHPDTHGVEYEYSKHSKLEIAARRSAIVNLYEISPHSFGGITSLEIASDHFRWREPMVLYYSDGDSDKDTLPAYSDRGHPLFVPKGIFDNPAAMQAHYRELAKNANNMRKYALNFAEKMHMLSVTFNDNPHAGDVVISPDRIHATEIFKAVVMACSGHKVVMNFTGGRAARDEKGNPILSLSQEPSEIEMKALLDQYVDEGNTLRREIAQLVEISVFVRVVYTQRSATNGLEDLLRIKGIIE